MFDHVAGRIAVRLRHTAGADFPGGGTAHPAPRCRLRHGAGFYAQVHGHDGVGNEKDEKDISAWQIDAQYEAQIASEVERIRGVRVVQAPYQVADFMPVNNMPGIYLTGMYEGANWQAIESATKAHCAKHALDAVLLVAQTSVPDFFTGSNQTLSGAGFYVRGPIRGVSVMHLTSRIGLLDCASGKPLAVHLLARSHHSRSRGGLFSLPYREISEKLSRMPIASWTPEIEQQIKANLIELPVQSWGPSIQSFFKP